MPPPACRWTITSKAPLAPLCLPTVTEPPAPHALRFDSFVDSFAGRLGEASGDALRRLRHNPNTCETP
jgi:hypothetical protein